MILIVDDSLDLLEGWKELLELDGYTVKGYSHGSALLEDESALGRGTALVTDYYLPDFNGIELVRRARQLKPDLPSILLTGAKDPSLKTQLASVPGLLLLNKPVGIDELESALARVMRR